MDDAQPPLLFSSRAVLDWLVTPPAGSAACSASACLPLGYSSRFHQLANGTCQPALGWPPEMAGGLYCRGPTAATPPPAQGVQYNLTWPRAHAPGGPVTVAFFRGTDCGAAPPLWSSQPLDPAVDGFAAHVAITVPDSILGDDVFLRVQGAGPSDRNYSDMFSVQRRAVLTAGGCVGNPRLPVTQPPATPPARCKAWPTWNLTALATGWCEVQAKGCRQYRCAPHGRSFGTPLGASLAFKLEPITAAAAWVHAFRRFTWTCDPHALCCAPHAYRRPQDFQDGGRVVFKLQARHRLHSAVLTQPQQPGARRGGRARGAAGAGRAGDWVLRPRVTRAGRRHGCPGLVAIETPLVMLMQG